MRKHRRGSRCEGGVSRFLGVPAHFRALQKPPTAQWGCPPSNFCFQLHDTSIPSCPAQRTTPQRPLPLEISLDKNETQVTMIRSFSPTEDIHQALLRTLSWLSTHSSTRVDCTCGYPTSVQPAIRKPVSPSPGNSSLCERFSDTPTAHCLGVREGRTFPIGRRVNHNHEAKNSWSLLPYKCSSLPSSLLFTGESYGGLFGGRLFRLLWSHLHKSIHAYIGKNILTHWKIPEKLFIKMLTGIMSLHHCF